ncbi:response regulator transcription factor [Metabacillus endolithicus]|uniref:Response regulator n=1 Tax=Metabacillus endolithicus TaxID=1535204 RepID=A0ABW5C197_9BACI|nr:response regulator transcription factor [Metabacillus endolithicus]UPG62564.1 response regulator transcription factor [Metabacillus endolithicus]
MRSSEGCRVVIVDDEQLIRQGIKHYMQWEQEGFQIVGEASNGQEALELIEKTKPHIVLTDIVMPIMDGEELTRIVKSKYPHIEIIILSSYGDFDYVRSTFQNGAVDYILKPKLDTESLLTVLKTAASQIPSLQGEKEESTVDVNIGHIIEKLISGYDTQYDENLILEVFPYSNFRLVAIDYRLIEEKSLEDISAINSEIEVLITSFAKDVKLEIFKIEEDVSVFLVNGSEDFLTLISELPPKILEHHSQLSILISETFTSFSQIWLKYNEVIKKMLQYRFYFPDTNIVIEKNLLKETPKIVSFNLDKFTNDFKHERFDLAFSYLDEHVTVLSSSFTTDIFEYKSFFGNVIFTISVLLSNLDFDVKSLENEKFSFFNKIDSAKTASGVVQQLQLFITKAKEVITTKKAHSGFSNFQLILDYIEEHYAEPLSLSDVANTFHFNPSYLSSYFATHNKEGFNEYLNKIRIEEAVKLLLNTTTPISEISGLVGYSDHSYFCKVFKKQKGLSPSQYRRNQKLK